MTKSTNTKQAILIIAHNNLELLRKNILLLNSSKIDIFIHIDRKSKIRLENILKDLFKEEKQQSHVEVFKEVKVNWGGYSQVETELLLIEKCLSYADLNNIDYGHLHLISGVDMPIKTPREFCDFFEPRRDKEFVHFYSSKLGEKIKDRYRYYHFLTECSWKRKRFFKKIYLALDYSMIFLQKIARVDRSFKIEYQYGANWFSITRDFAGYILSKRPEIEKAFKYTNCCDEIFIQTFLNNSNFKDNLFLKGFSDNYLGIMRLIDWGRGNPYTFRSADYKEIVKSKMMFARKFDKNTDKEIINKVFMTVMERKNEED